MSRLGVFAVSALVFVGYVFFHQLAGIADRTAVDAAAVRQLADFHVSFLKNLPPESAKDYEARLKDFQHEEEKELISRFADRVFEARQQQQ